MTRHVAMLRGTLTAVTVGDDSEALRFRDSLLGGGTLPPMGPGETVETIIRGAEAWMSRRAWREHQRQTAAARN